MWNIKADIHIVHIFVLDTYLALISTATIINTQVELALSNNHRVSLRGTLHLNSKLTRVRMFELKSQGSRAVLEFLLIE